MLDTFKPLVVGYKGEIGSFILGGLLKEMPKASDIWCVDMNDDCYEVVDRIWKSHYIFLCVPIEETINWIRRYKAYLAGKVIIEQCTLKGDIVNHPDLEGLIIHSMHILFRPSATPKHDDREIAFIDGQLGWTTMMNLAGMLDSEFIIYDSVIEHDREMAILQGISHRVILTIERRLKGMKGGTYISKQLQHLGRRIRGGNKNLLNVIQKNDKLPDELGGFIGEIRGFDLNKYI
jgi:prephenate dehydrogenase